MENQPRITSLGEFLDRLEQASQGDDPVALETLVEATGRRSFAPLLLLAGLIAVSPLSGIPGMPTSVALIVLVVAGQLVLGRKHFWLPEFLLHRTVSKRTLVKALAFLRRPATWVDRLLRPRLSILTHGVGVYVIALICVVIAITMPPMEPLPFTASTAGAALSAYALAIIAEDGLVALVAMGFTLLSGYLVFRALM